MQKDSDKILGLTRENKNLKIEVRDIRNYVDENEDLLREQTGRMENG